MLKLLSGKPIMCAYKLCKVEFRYWGLQVVRVISLKTYEFSHELSGGFTTWHCEERCCEHIDRRGRGKMSGSA